MIKELIKVTKQENGDVAVSGRELHEFLEVNTNYSTWMNRMIDYGFSENEDYILLSNFGMQVGSGGHNKIDHVLKLDMAKEISMIQRTDRGKEARQYFIKVEKDYTNIKHDLVADSYMIVDPIERAKRWIEEEQVRLELKQELEIALPKSDYVDKFVDSEGLQSMKQVANTFGYGRNTFMKLLREEGVLTLDNKPYQRYMNLEWFELKTVVNGNYINTVTLATAKGVYGLAKKLSLLSK